MHGANIAGIQAEVVERAVTRGLDSSAPMQDSGVDYLGMVPAGWGAVKMRPLYSERNTKVSDADYPPLSVTKDVIVPQLDTVAFTEHEDNRKLVKAGNFVINSSADRHGSCGISALGGSVTLISIVL